jgi:hypothetical protein
MLFNLGSGNRIPKDQINSGDFVKIMDEGRKEESQFVNEKTGKNKIENIFSLWWEGNDYEQSINWTSIKKIVEIYGNDSSKWVGRWLRITKEYARNLGTEVIYFDPLSKEECQRLDEQKYKPKQQVNQKTIEPEDIAWEE